MTEHGGGAHANVHAKPAHTPSDEQAQVMRCPRSKFDAPRASQLGSNGT
jgi:hypothetical protein